jgi:hypothetical protein
MGCRLDDQMKIVWQKCLGGYRSEHPTYLTQTEDGGFVIIGTTNSNDGDVSGNHSFSGDFRNWMGDYGSNDIWVVKFKQFQPFV